jgi:hypothetical protein
MGATTKSITGLFANVCGRNVCGRIACEPIAAGHGTRSAAARGYLSLLLSWLSHGSWRDELAGLDQFSWLAEARDQARWLLKRLDGQLSSALPNTSGMFPNISGILSPARCPVSSRPEANVARSQAVGRRQAGIRRFHG